MQITMDTTDVFIECTGTDITKAQIVLNTMCTMFSEYCSNDFEVEPVKVIDSSGNAKSKLPDHPCSFESTVCLSATACSWLLLLKCCMLVGNSLV